MSLPSTYSTSSHYFKDALNFLDNHQWLYNYPNTDILVNDVFTNFKSEWCQYFKNLPNNELNKLPVNDMESCPPSLKELLNNIAKLKPESGIEDFAEENDFEFSHNCCLSEKKRHEIVILAPVINKICKDTQASLIIDIGSGLGYLSHHLHSKYRHKVLGIEWSKQYVEMAYTNQERFYPRCRKEVIFTDHYINADSAATITSLVERNFDSVGFKSSCLVGLHACADLSVTVLDLFNQLPFIKSLVIMPCCYHRLKLKEEERDNEYFYNFPVSKVLKDLCNQFGAEKFLRRPFLRLACQETYDNFNSMSEEEHTEHARNLMFRCILQFVAESEKCAVKRLKRKSNRSRVSNPDFEDYLNNLKNTHQLKPHNPNNNQLAVNDYNFVEKMREKWKEYKGKCYLIEVLTGLQASIQNVCENIILLDRIEYLKEKGYQAEIQKITNDVVSPRCYALVSTKNECLKTAV